MQTRRPRIYSLFLCGSAREHCDFGARRVAEEQRLDEVPYSQRGNLQPQFPSLIGEGLGERLQGVLLDTNNLL